MTNNELIRKIVEKTFVDGFIDDHNVRIVKEKPNAIVLFIRGIGCEAGVCPVYENTVFSLNPLYMNEETGDIHLSMASCGGNIDTRGTNLEKACEKYNKDHSFDKFASAFFSQVILITRKDYFEKLVH